MIFKQIHKLPTNSNLEKIVLIMLVTIGAGVIIYQLIKPENLKLHSPVKKD